MFHIANIRKLLIRCSQRGGNLSLFSVHDLTHNEQYHHNAQVHNGIKTKCDEWRTNDEYQQRGDVSTEGKD